MVHTCDILWNSIAYTEIGEQEDLLNITEGTGVSFIAELFQDSMFFRTVFEQHTETKFQYKVQRQ
jgi:hypothetical protein